MVKTAASRDGLLGADGHDELWCLFVCLLCVSLSKIHPIIKEFVIVCQMMCSELSPFDTEW